jgi:hypothetical protein
MRLAKPAQFAAFGGAAVFLILLFSQISSNQPISELPNRMGSAAASFREKISGSLGRGNIKSMMETSEKLWMKTIDQRRAYRQKFPDMDLYVYKHPVREALIGLLC